MLVDHLDKIQFGFVLFIGGEWCDKGTVIVKGHDENLLQ